MTPATLGALAIAFFISTFLGYAIAILLLPASITRRFAWAFAPGIGAGLCALLFFLFRRPMFSVEFALLIGAVWCLYRSKRGAQLLPKFGQPSMLGLFLGVALGLAAGALMLRVHRMPHGDWDGWAIWNTHARFLYRDGPNWKNDIDYSFHGDYPLLAPSTAARFWRYAGQEIPEAGAFLGVILALSGIAVLALTLSELRDSFIGILLAIVLTGTTFYIDHASSQYADVPLSFFILATIALLCLHDGREGERGTLALAGFTAGCAGWTKNEGLLFIAAACLALLLPIVRMRWRALQRFFPFAAGLALPLAVILLFKLTIHTQTDLIEYQHDTIAKILDLSRHEMIIKATAETLTSFGQWAISPLVPLFAFVLFRGFDRGITRNPGWVAGVTILAMVLGGYYFVYLVTPIDLALHLDSSLSRLLLQLWPSFLLVLGLLCRPAASVGRRL